MVCFVQGYHEYQSIWMGWYLEDTKEDKNWTKSILKTFNDLNSPFDKLFGCYVD